MKTVCVIGLGQFGEHLAISLSKHGGHVIAIDNDQEKVNKIADNVAHAYVADAKDKEVLETLIPKDVDACVVSLGEQIEPNRAGLEPGIFQGFWFTKYGLLEFFYIRCDMCYIFVLGPVAQW